MRKPNFPDDVEAREGRKGSSVGTRGLNALDEEREASLADEGGASGAVVESQDIESLRRLASELPAAHLLPAESASRRGFRWRGAALVAAALGVAGFLLARR